MIFRNIIAFLIVIVLFTSCEQKIKTGTHFQGRDCLLCHNVDLKSEKALHLGGTLFNSNGASPDDLVKDCKEPVYIQFLESNGSVAFDSRDIYKGNENGFKGRGNFFLLKSDANVSVGNYFMRLLLEDNTTLAKSSGFHTFLDAFNPYAGTDTNNRYSCNACHSVDPQGGASGVVEVLENVGLCLDAPSDLSAKSYFKRDVYPRMMNDCYSCHKNGATAATIAYFLTLNDPTQTLTDFEGTTFSMIDPKTPSNSRVLHCPNNVDHNSLSQCIKDSSEYNRTLEWLIRNKEDQ